MIITLNNLAAEEERVAQLIASAPADLEARDRSFERRGVYRYYDAIFTAYWDLLENEETEHVQAEALRRAVFLAWYSCIAPPQLSGLSEFSDVRLEEVFDTADRALDSDAPDAQLAWMLPWYFHEADVVFTRFPGLGRLVDYCSGQPKDAWRSAGLTPEALQGRGALGRYWLGVVGVRGV